MKLYSLCYECGEYSDYSYTFIGTFASREEAESEISRRNPVYGDDELRPKFEKRQHKIFTAIGKKLAEAKELLATTLKEQAKFKAKNPGWGVGKIKNLTDLIVRDEIALAKGLDLGDEAFEHYKKYSVRRPDPENYTVIEHNLGEIVDMYKDGMPSLSDD